MILAYDFPPYVSVGGLRPYSWYKYLHRYGIYPIVVTRQWNNNYGNHLDYVAPGYSDNVSTEASEYGTIVSAPYHPNLSNRLLLKHGEHRFRMIRKIITGMYEYLQWFLPTGTKYSIYNAAKDYLNTNSVDLIIATGDPFILFRYASRLSRRHHIPWVADYRDPWIEKKNVKTNPLSRIFNRMMARKHLKNVKAITTVSEFVKIKIQKNIDHKPIYIIPNGYDPEVRQTGKNIQQSDNLFTLGFAGTIYPWHPISEFLQCCSLFLEKAGNNKLEINFYGTNVNDQISRIVQTKFTNLEGIVNLYPRLPNKDMATRLATSNAFILFNDYSILGTKIFDYLALQRIILLCFQNDPDANRLRREHYLVEQHDTVSKHLQQDLIEHTRAGIILKDQQHLLDTLTELHERFLIHKQIECNSEKIDDYSRIKQIENLSELFFQILKPGKQ